MEIICLIIFVLGAAFACYKLFNGNPQIFLCDMDCASCSHQMCGEEHKQEVKERTNVVHYR